MALVDSLLTAMVRADGDALVMHVGERPIVVSGARTIDLSNHGMNLGAMVGMLGQLLSDGAQATLKEFGAVEHELPSRDPDRFSVVAARSGDDIWIEIRRRRENEIAALADRPALVASVPDPGPEATDTAGPTSASAVITLESAVVTEPVTVAVAADTTSQEETPRPEAEAPTEAVAVTSSPIDPLPHEPLAVSEPGGVEAEPAIVEVIGDAQLVTQVELATEPHDVAASETPEAASAAPDDIDVPISHGAIAASLDVPEVEVAPADEHDAAPSVEAEPLSEVADIQADQLADEPAAVEDQQPIAVAEDTPPREDAVPAAVLAPAAIAVLETTATSLDSAAQAVLASAAVSRPVSALVSGTSMDAARHEAQSAGGSPPESGVAGQAPEHATPGASAGNSGGVGDAPVTRTVRIEVPPRAAASRVTGIDRLLRAADAVGASELFVVSQARPYVRVAGNVRPLQDESLLLGSDIEALISDVTPEPWRDAVRRGDPAEWLIELADIGRVRCATFRDHRGPGANFHFAHLRATTADELQLSAETRLLATEPDGLVLVNGAAGSDMAAIVAAFVDLLNQQRADYIITLEPQVRVLHMNRKALVSQREVGLDPARTLAAARAALREQPDVLVIESLASGELARLAVEASQDRLVIASIDSTSAPAAVQRLIELVPAEHRQHAREQLARRFRGAVAQLLLRKSSGGRVAARELLTGTRAVARVLLDGDLSRLSDQLEASGAMGPAPLTDTLVEYVRSGTVDVREAVRKAPDADRLVARLKAAGADLSPLEGRG